MVFHSLPPCLSIINVVQKASLKPMYDAVVMKCKGEWRKRRIIALKKKLVKGISFYTVTAE